LVAATVVVVLDLGLLAVVAATVFVLPDLDRLATT